MKDYVVYECEEIPYEGVALSERFRTPDRAKAMGFLESQSEAEDIYSVLRIESNAISGTVIE